ncbi:MAG: hypothetical protein E2O67_01620 [Deltaproteobacteria bacterium]|nr:MAG: hypothetical protein E2O67_01620 [Deltaproteobacteria bacterium]
MVTTTSMHEQKKPEEITHKLPVYKRIWEWWKPVAQKIGNFQARVILTVFYFTMFMPFAILVKLFTDPLRIKPKTKKGWIERKDEQVDDLLARARKQF